MSSSSSPLLVVQCNAGSEKLCVPSSPTSTVEIHKLSDMNSTIDASSMSVDCLSSMISEINCSPSTLPLNIKKNKVAIRTIHNSDIKISKPFHMVLDLKLQLCCDTPLNVADIMIIRNGKELSNCDALSSEDLKSSKVFVMVNSEAKTQIPITLKTQGVDGAPTKTLKLPLNMKVSQLKKQLFSGKMASLKPESQRIIVGGKVLQDCFIIGDYLLYAILSKPVTSTASSSSSSAKSHSTPSGKVITPLCTLYLSKTTNLKHEVNINFVSGVKGAKQVREMKYGVEISKPISVFNTVLHREFRHQLPSESKPYVFSLRVPNDNPNNAISSNSTAKKAVGKATTPSYTLIELDQSKTLLDYGIDPSTKNVTVEIVQRDLNNPLTYMTSLQIMLFMEQMLVFYAQAARLKCEAMGIDLTTPPPAVVETPAPENTVNTASGRTILSLMQAADGKSSMFNSDSDTDESSGGRSPNSVVNSKKRPTSPREVVERSVSPKRSAGEIATHVSGTSEKVTPVKKASGGGGLFGNLKLKKGFLSKK